MFEINSKKNELANFCDFSDVFDLYRLVDPDTHEIYDIEGGKALKTDLPLCYEIWKKDAPCRNCVSVRTCREKEKYFKLEFVDGRIFLVSALPLIIEGKIYSLELAKEITDSLLVEDTYHKDSRKLKNLIQDFNSLSVMDAFTGLYNSRYIMDCLENFTTGCKLSPLCLMLMDIDGFQSINEKYGHMAGDTIILQIARLLHSKERANPGVIAGRIGGGSFAVVFDNYSLDSAKQIAGEIISSLDTFMFGYGEKGSSFMIHCTSAVEQYSGQDFKVFFNDVENSVRREKRNAESK